MRLKDRGSKIRAYSDAITAVQPAEGWEIPYSTTARQVHLWILAH